MKKICIAIFLMLVIPALATTASTEEVNQDIQINTNDVITFGYDGDNPLTVNLIADGGSEGFIVGEVHVWDDASGLHVVYDITDEEWEMTESHLHIGFDADIGGDFPLTKQGNPQIGKFDYQMDYDPPVMGDEYVIFPYSGEPYIAAHCVVRTICDYGGNADLIAIQANLPDQVTFSVTYPYSGGPAYFPHTYITGLDGGMLDVYSWCVDTDHTINQGVSYTANIYSSYELLPAGLIEYPENLDKVNWILNQGFVGQSSPGGYGTYTYGDVQRAIWALVEDGQSTSGLGSWNINRVNEILDGANAYGEDYIPPCGGTIGVILAPVNNQQVIIAQVIVGELPVAPCEPIYCGETAWAEGFEFPGKSWAMYFEYGTDQDNNPIGREINLKGLMQLFFARIARILEALRVA